MIDNKLLQLESILVAESTLSWQRNRRWILHEQKIKCFKPIFSRTFILPLRRVSSSLPVSSSRQSTQKWRRGFQDTRSTMMTSIMAMTLMMVMTAMMISMMVMTDSGDDNRINQTTYLQSDIFTQSCPAFKRGRRVEGMEISGDHHICLRIVIDRFRCGHICLKIVTNENTYWILIWPDFVLQEPVSHDRAALPVPAGLGMREKNLKM